MPTQRRFILHATCVLLTFAGVGLVIYAFRMMGPHDTPDPFFLTAAGMLLLAPYLVAKNW